MKVAVVGGGITGLAAALDLADAGAEVTVFEAAAHPGGKVGSHREEGFLTEDGPNALAATATTASELARRLGLTGQIRSARPRSVRWVFRRGRLQKAPGPGLLSTAGWLRAFCEPFAPGAKLTRELPLRDYLIQRLGEEAGGLAAELMAGGVYAGDPARLSASAAFPSLGRLAARHRSLAVAALSSRREEKRPRGSLWSFAEGLGTLTGALAARLGDRVRLRSRVSELAPDGGSFRVSWAAGEEAFEGVALALPAFAAAELVRGFAPALADALAGITYAPVAVVHLGVRDDDLARPAQGFGLLDGEGSLSLLGTLFPSWLFPGRAPEGYSLLTSMAGGARRPELTGKGDGELVDLCRRDLARAMGLSGSPVYLRVVRHERAIPQVEIGHADRLRAIEQAARAWPGLALCGAAYHGVSVDACAADGLRAARQLADR